MRSSREGYVQFSIYFSPIVVLILQFYIWKASNKIVVELSGVSKSRRACSRSVRRPPAVRLHFIELDFVLIESKPGSQTWLAILAVLEKT